MENIILTPEDIAFKNSMLKIRQSQDMEDCINRMILAEHQMKAYFLQQEQKAIEKAHQLKKDNKTTKRTPEQIQQDRIVRRAYRGTLTYKEKARVAQAKRRERLLLQAQTAAKAQPKTDTEYAPTEFLDEVVVI